MNLTNLSELGSAINDYNIGGTFFSNLTTSLIGAGVGAILGAYFGLRFARAWDRKKHQEEINRTKKETFDLIITELKAIQKGFNEFYSKDATGTIILEETSKPTYPDIETFAFDSVVNSGNFSLIPNNLQIKISNVYMKIKHCNSFVEIIIDFYITHQPPNDYIKNLGKKMSAALGKEILEARTEINKLLSELESEQTNHGK